MTKADIARIVHERVGFNQRDSICLVDSILSTMTEALEHGESVKISGFGHFMLRSKSARRARNPKTGEEVMIAPRSVVTFRASPILKKKLLKRDS